MLQLLRFGWLEAPACLFAGTVVAGLVVAQVVPLPIARYDALLLSCVAATLPFWALAWRPGARCW